MPFLLAFASSLLYGSADFLGGWASRRGPVLAVTAASQAIGLLALLAAALAAGGALRPEAGGWAVAAGVSGSVGVLLLYRALAVGTVSTVAPVISMIAIFLPVAFGLLAGERPGPAALTGIALGVLAVALIGAGERGGGTRAFPTPAALATAVASGLFVGGFLVCIGRIPAGSGLWPLALARAVGTVALSLALLARRGEARVPRGLWPAIAGCGAFDVTANLLYWLAARHGPRSLMATLVSLAPASTVVLARLVMHERLAKLQQAGVALALVAIALLAQGMP
ncbi:MAG: DMT family transporter [Candidatus Eisenbacteria bacterium]|nr:DMT family transporter [Candidatus Eisenbacteria bacterium]